MDGTVVEQAGVKWPVQRENNIIVGNKEQVQMGDKVR